MHLASVDYMAANGKSIIHRANPHSKILVALLILIAVIVADSPIKLGLILLYTIVLIAISSPNIKEIGHLALYPVFFSLVFALIKIQQSLVEAMAVILRALAAAMSMLFLITTTPYVDIFSVLSILLPGVIVDIFIFTYRSLFILLDKLSSLFRSVKIRGGYHPIRIFKNIKNMAGMLGIMVIHSFDMSERMYNIFKLRGYKGRLPLTRENRQIRAIDIALVVMSVAILAGVIIKWNN